MIKVTYENAKQMVDTNKQRVGQPALKWNDDAKQYDAHHTVENSCVLSPTSVAFVWTSGLITIDRINQIEGQINEMHLSRQAAVELHKFLGKMIEEGHISEN